MRHHAERIRRIQALCAKLEHTIEDSHAVQKTVEQLCAESDRLLQDLRPPRRKEERKTKNGRRAKNHES